MSPTDQLIELARIARENGAGDILEYVTEDEAVEAAAQISRIASAPVIDAVEKAALDGKPCSREAIALAMIIHRARAFITTSRALQQSIESQLKPLDEEAAAELERVLFGRKEVG